MYWNNRHSPYEYCFIYVYGRGEGLEGVRGVCVCGWGLLVFFLFKLIVLMYWLTKITSTLHFRIKIFIRTATFQRVLCSCFDVVLVSDFSVLASSVGSSPSLARKRKILKKSTYNYDKDHRFWNTRLNKCSCWVTKKYNNKSI